MIDPGSQERFWAKVNRRGGTRGCWYWTGAQIPSGHGMFTLVTPEGKRTGTTAHRVAFELHHGRPIEPGCVLHHSCGKPVCVNPAHLVEMTNEEHSRVHNEQPAVVRLCQRGHNDWVRSRTTNRRRCRTCHNEAERRRARAKRHEQLGPALAPAEPLGPRLGPDIRGT